MSALGRGELDAQPFPRALCDALFAAVLVDDEVDPDLRLPDAVRLDYREAELIACFRLARQLWREDLDRRALRRFAGLLLRGRSPDAGERMRVKHVRAKFKHVRYAHALYGAGHRYPPMLDSVTIAMGKAQDAFRTGGRVAIVARAALLRTLLSAPAWRRLRVEGDRLQPTTPAAFRALLEADRALLDALVAAPVVTGPVFHAARKVVGRNVSFWNTIQVLQPSEDRFRMTRWLSAINGQMGELHDRLVERRARDRTSYEGEFALPDEIRARIVALNARMRESAGG